MGYESRVIIARRYNSDPDWAEVIAELKLSKMAGGFLSLFKNEYTGVYYDFYDGETRIKEDKYGDKLTYATFNDVYEWCVKNARAINYRRLDMLLAVLDSVRTGWVDELDEFIVIHYGY